MKNSKPLAPSPSFPKQKLKKPGIEFEMKLRSKYGAAMYRAANKLEGKTALITGGDSGIGRAVAVLYARNAADVAIAYLEAEEGDAAQEVAEFGASVPMKWPAQPEELAPAYVFLPPVLTLALAILREPFYLNWEGKPLRPERMNF